MNVTLIAGPPCAGKTTYVHEHHAPGDLILDADTIYQALSGEQLHQRRDGFWPFVQAAFGAVVGEIDDRRHDDRGAWVIRTAPQRRDRERYRRVNHARVIVLETPAETCDMRAYVRFGKTARLTEYLDLIEAWWDKYEPDPRDTRINNQQEEQ